MSPAQWEVVCCASDRLLVSRDDLGRLRATIVRRDGRKVDLPVKSVQMTTQPIGTDGTG